MANTHFWRPGTDRELPSESIAFTGQANRHARLPLLQQRSLLPISAYRRNILYALEKYQVLIIVGETGTGWFSFE